VPAALLPYGGFGDPDTPAPVWKPGRGVDTHKYVLSQAQDRFMRIVRTHLRSAGKTDEEFEQELGYRKYGLTRKLNGQELMTMRDVLKVSSEVPSALTALAVKGDLAKVAEEPAPFRRTRARSEGDEFQSLIHEAVDALDQAADTAAGMDSAKAKSVGPLLRSLRATVTEVGRLVDSSTRRKRTR
jgi:hypothetical protein